MTQLTREELQLLAEVLSQVNVKVTEAPRVLDLLQKLNDMITESVDTGKKSS